MTKHYQPAPSILHTIAKEVDISYDLTAQSDKTIAELLDEEKKEKNQTQENKESN